MVSTMMPKYARNVGNKSRFFIFAGLGKWTETEVGLSRALTVTSLKCLLGQYMNCLLYMKEKVGKCFAKVKI